MPPKKKDSKKAIKPAPSEDPPQSIDTTPLPVQKQSIPRKPMFKTIRCDCETKFRRMRTKLWKASSFHLLQPAGVSLWSRDVQNIRKKESLNNLMSSKTSKRALKNVRNLTIDYELSDWIPYKFLTRTLFRLDQLVLTLPRKHSILPRILKNSVHSNLKSLIIPQKHYNQPGENLENIVHLISRFKNLQSLFLGSSLMTDGASGFGGLKFSFPKLRRLKKLNSGACVILHLNAPKTIRSYKKLQDFTVSRFVPLSNDTLRFIPCHDIRNLTLGTRESSLSLVTLSSKFPNLESLSLLFYSTEETSLQFTTCPNLESLSLSSSTKIQITDFSFLSHLKTLTFYDSKFAHSSVPIESLPKLESLQIGSAVSRSFDSTFCKDLVSKSPNLKVLSIESEAQLLNEFLQDNSFDFSLEKLTLKCSRINPPFTAFSKNLSAFIKQNSNLRELELHINEGFRDFIEPIMKSIKSLSGLETFRFNLGNPIELQDHKIPLLKDVILKVKSAHLGFSCFYFDSKDVSSLANALIKNEKLEEFTLNVHFSKTSDAALNSFIEFLRNAKRIKRLNLSISGCPEEKQVELEKALGYDISFWERDGKKISW